MCIQHCGPQWVRLNRKLWQYMLRLIKLHKSWETHWCISENFTDTTTKMMNCTLLSSLSNKELTSVAARTYTAALVRLCMYVTNTYALNLLIPISVNQEEQELRLMVSKRTTWPGSVPWLMATHTRGYSCSGTTSISNTFSGLGRGKSKCCHGNRERRHRGYCQCFLRSKEEKMCSLENV